MLSAALDLVLPPSCGGCGAPRSLVCPACRALLAAEPRRRWPRPTPAGLPEPWSAADYNGAIRKMINVYKEEGRTALARPLGECLAHVLATALDAGAHRSSRLLVPIPSRRRATRRRGHDPVRRLAALAASELGEGVTVAPILRSRRPMADQAGLSAGERAANLREAFSVTRDAAGRHAILIDDVITTGATIAEAARALREAGVHVWMAATIAATPRRRAPSS